MGNMATDLASPATLAPPLRAPSRTTRHATSTGPVLGLSREAWTRIGIITLLFAALFWPNLRRLWGKTNPFYGEPNWGHSVFVPLIGLYYLYLNREELLKARVRPGWLGLPIMLGGLLLFAYGIWPGQNDFVKDVGMVITLFGMVAVLCGWQVMKVAWFPVLFLLAALPWPGLVYSWVAMPLQKLAASAAAVVMNLSGVEAQRLGTKIVIGDVSLNPRILNVAEACAGMKSLMTFIAVGGAVGFLAQRPLWQKLFISASAVPIAIFCNTMRVAGQGLLDHYVSQKLSESFAHQFVGVIMLIPAFFLLLLVAWVLENLFIEEVDKRKLAPAVAGPAAKSVAPKPAPSRAVAPATTPAASPAPAPAMAKPAAPAMAPASAPGTMPAMAPKAVPVARPVAPKPVTPAAPQPAPKPAVAASAPQAAPAHATPARPTPAQPAPASAHPTDAATQMAEATRRRMSAGNQRDRRPRPATPAQKPPAPPTAPAPAQNPQPKEGQ